MAPGADLVAGPLGVDPGANDPVEGASEVPLHQPEAAAGCFGLGKGDCRRPWVCVCVFAIPRQGGF